MCRDGLTHHCLSTSSRSLGSLAGLPLGLGPVFSVALHSFMPVSPSGKLSATISSTSVGGSPESRMTQEIWALGVCTLLWAAWEEVHPTILYRSTGVSSGSVLTSSLAYSRMLDRLFFFFFLFLIVQARCCSNTPVSVHVPWLFSLLIATFN